jgi:hypothetical protein
MVMTREEIFDFLNKISRSEFEERPVEYSKGVRVALIALGYDEDWVNGEFREYLETTYEYYFDFLISAEK